MQGNGIQKELHDMNSNVTVLHLRCNVQFVHKTRKNELNFLIVSEARIPEVQN
jgi:hypothetical protein